jgi:hypothetical protein
MSEIEQIKEVLKDKMIIRIDKKLEPVDNCFYYVVIFVNCVRKSMGHIEVKIPVFDRNFLNQFKSILLKNFNVSIKGFKNWKKLIKDKK